METDDDDGDTGPARPGPVLARPRRARRGAVPRALRVATHEVGFFYLTGHGIPDAVIARAFVEARRFFALPEEDKAQAAMLRSPHFPRASQDPDNVISGTFGDNLLKARLRAHPDVAAAHHPDLLRLVTVVHPAGFCWP